MFFPIFHLTEKEKNDSDSRYIISQLLLKSAVTNGPSISVAFNTKSTFPASVTLILFYVVFTLDSSWQSLLHLVHCQSCDNGEREREKEREEEEERGQAVNWHLKPLLKNDTYYLCLHFIRQSKSYKQIWV